MEQIELNGKWSFTPEGENSSITVNVPGTWKDVPALEGYDAGKYSRVFSVNEKQMKKRAFIRFGGVYRSADVWVNGEKIDSHKGFQAPFSLDITNALQLGDNLLEVYVDGRRYDGDYFGFSSTFEMIPYDFDGIYDSITLRFCEQQSLTGLYTPIDLETNEAFFLFDSSNALKNSTNGKLHLVICRDGNLAFEGDFSVEIPGGEGEIRLSLPLDLFELWSPEQPMLYDVEATLTVGDVSDTHIFITGFKHMETRGTDFYLNGDPYYLLGYGDDWIFPNGLPFGKDVDYFEAIIGRAKEYGFNNARNHSYFPFEKYMDAADRMGLLIQPELALANLPREYINEENSAIFLSEWRALIRAYRHHPCIAVWCGGNEMEWGFPFSKDLYNEAKRLDPYRPVESTDGLFMACDVDDTFDFASIVPADYTDYLPYGELKDMFTRDRCGKPQIVHEMGNYTTVFDIDLLPRLEPKRAKRTIEIKNIIEKKNCRALYNKASKNALELQKFCHKLNIEKARLSPEFCGYHFWTIVDFYETTQGLLNIFYEDKAFCADEFKKINRQSVLLWDTDQYVFRSGEKIDISIKLSKFGNDLPLSGKLTLTLFDAQKEYVRQKAEKTFSGHGIMEAMRCNLQLPEVSDERIYTLNARLENKDDVIENSWEVFCVPQVKIGTQKEIYIHYLSRPLIDGDGVPVRHFTIPQPIGEGQLILTEHLYGSMLEAVLNQGASMLLLAGEDTFKETVKGNSFKTPWWDPGEIWYLNHTNNIQISAVVEDCPATKMIPYDGAWKIDLFGAVEQTHTVNLDALGFDVEALIYGVDTKFDRLGYLFQFAFGKGKVLVCTLRHKRDDLKDPAVDYVMKRLINYAMSEEFKPEKQVKANELLSALKGN